MLGINCLIGYTLQYYCIAQVGQRISTGEKYDYDRHHLFPSFFFSLFLSFPSSLISLLPFSSLIPFLFIFLNTYSFTFSFPCPSQCFARRCLNRSCDETCLTSTTRGTLWAQSQPTWLMIPESVNTLFDLNVADLLMKLLY